jgi:phosphohistidine phosphatase
MRQLLLLRHAKSSWEDPHCADHDRPLNLEGRADGAALRQAFHDAGFKPDLVLVSTARRTRETFELLEPLDGSPRVEKSNDLYLASPRQILDRLAQLSQEITRVLVIAHNPGLHDLAMMMAGAHGISLGGKLTTRLARGLPTGALLEFSVAGAWADLPHGARLLHFMTPDDVMRTAL